MTCTNEVALWAHQPYIVPFSKLPHSVTRTHSLCFLIRLHPWDQGPITYIVTFPRSPSALSPGGAFFSHHVQVRMLMFNFIKQLLYVIYRQILFTFGIWFSCVQVLVPQSYIPFRYMFNTGMWSFPLNINCISQSHPPTFTFKVPTSGSTTLSRLLHFCTITR